MPSVQKDQSTWLKRILLPAWILRLGITGILIVAYIVAVTVAVRIVKDGKGESGLTHDEWKIGLGLAVLFLLLMIFVFLLDILCVIKFLRHNLTPKFMLIINSIQVVIWAGLIGIEIYSVSHNGPVGGLIGSLIVAASFVILLIYSVIAFRRQKRGGQLGNYAAAVNPALPQTWQQTNQHQQQYMQPQEHGHVPYQTGAFNPYEANTSYQGAHAGLEMKPPANGAAADYYAGRSHSPPLPETYAPPVQGKQYL